MSVGDELPTVHAAVLAAGLSRRFGSPKMLAPIGGQPMLRRVVDVVEAVVGDRYHIVLGVPAAHPTAALIIETCALDTRRILYNVQAPSGLASSLALAVDSAPDSAAGLLVVLGDQPGICSDELRQLIDLWQRTPQVTVAARYADVIGAPCLLPRTLFGAVRNLQGDRGAQALLKSLPALNSIEIPSAAFDIDTTADLERWNTAARQR